jgi:hypothetical protein
LAPPILTEEGQPLRQIPTRRKTWRVSIAISALPNRNTSVRFSKLCGSQKTSVAQIRTLETQQLKGKTAYEKVNNY